MFISFVVKMIELITMIMSFSYFFMIFWIILCDTYFDFILDGTYDNLNDTVPPFFNVYELDNQDQALVSLKVFYFSFTTLTTVGFGDFYPHNDYERAFASMMLLFGVMIFSVIIGEYSAQLELIKDFNKEFDDGDSLRQFFNVIRRFNKNESMDFEEKKKYEEYFYYRWDKDKNQAFLDESG